MSVLVSIIMPCYNSENTIVKSIYSVLHQTYTNWEMIIVDDCSTDDTLKIISGFQKTDYRIKVLNNSLNEGVSYSRNKGLKNASGKFVAFLDSDDFWHSKKLEIQLNEMILNNYDLSFTSYYRVNINQKIIGSVSVKNVSYRYSDLLKGNMIAMSSSMIKSEKINNIFFNKIGHEDYFFWLNILEKGILAHSIKAYLTYYTVHDSSLSSNKFKAIKYTWNIYRRYANFSFAKATYFFLIHIFHSLLKRV